MKPQKTTYPGLDGHPQRNRIVPEKVEKIAEDSGVVVQPTIGETSISAMEATEIRTEVCAVMEAEFAEGRAALRKNLGLPKENRRILALYCNQSQ